MKERKSGKEKPRPPQNYEITPELLERVEAAARAGNTIAEIAILIGWNRSTLFEKKKKHSDLNDAIKKGQITARTSVANAIYERGMGGSDVLLMYWEKTRYPKERHDKFMDPDAAFKLPKGTPIEQLQFIAERCAAGELSQTKATTLSNIIMKACDIEEVTTLKALLEETKRKLDID